MCQLGKLTDKGHRALGRYREAQEPHELNESIAHFERARDLCPPDHHGHAIVLFNLATAKLIYCQVNNVSPDFDAPIDLYRASLSLRPSGHPDYPLTLFNLGIALVARFQRLHNEVDVAEGKAFLSQVLDVTPADSHVYQGALLTLSTATISESMQVPELPQTAEDDVDVDEEILQMAEFVL